MACSARFPDPVMVLFEYIPFGDLLGYLRRSRGLSDNYYKDPDVKPSSSLSSKQLLKFSREIADGMAFLSANKVNRVVTNQFWVHLIALLKSRTALLWFLRCKNCLWMHLCWKLTTTGQWGKRWTSRIISGCKIYKVPFRECISLPSCKSGIDSDCSYISLNMFIMTCKTVLWSVR